MCLRLLEVPLMRRFFENKIAFVATVLAFAMALAVSALYGNGIALPAPSSSPIIDISVNALPGIPPFDCEGCPQPSVQIMASVQALPGIPPFDCEGCPQPSAKIMASVQAL